MITSTVLKRTLTTLFTAALLMGGLGTGQAALIDQLDGTVLDTDLNIFWLQNANTAATNQFGLTQSLNVVPDAGEIGSNGQLTWFTATDWIAAMNMANYLGFTNWRLPTTLDPDSSCTDDSAGTMPSADPKGFNCTGSELGHLFNVEGVMAVTPGLFSNVQFSTYWSTELETNDTAAWNFHFDTGLQRTSGKGFGGTMFGSVFAWAVRDGDVVTAPIPEPSTMLLLGSGLVGLIGYRWKKAQV